MGIVLDIVPNHMAVDPENRFWADGDAAPSVLRYRPGDRAVAPLRRHRRDGGRPPGGRRGLRRDSSAGPASSSMRAWWTACGSTMSTVSPTRRATWTGFARGAPSASGSRRSSPPTSGCPTGRCRGTVGYEFSNEVVGLFIDPAGEAELTAVWERAQRRQAPVWRVGARGEARAGADDVRPELERLARVAGAPVSPDQGPEPGTQPGGPTGAAIWPPQSPLGGSPSDASVDRLALAAASLPVYRTYVAPSAGEFITRFQQTTPAIMAKGVEDTAFYRYGRLLALNDVGGDPGRFGIGVAATSTPAAPSEPCGSRRGC